MDAMVGSSAELDEGCFQRRSWKERTTRFARTLFRCSCIEAQERDWDTLCSQDARDDNLIACMAGEVESIHIIVEDLGLINPSFILCTDDIQVEEEEDPTPRCAMARSSSSVSVSQRAARKKKLAPLSSLPLQQRAELGSMNSEEDSLVFGVGASSSAGTSDGGLLTPPVINLIPPTPSDVDIADDDQFFDINSEEDSVALTSGSEGVDSVCSLATGKLETDEDKDGRMTEQVSDQDKPQADDVKVEDHPLSPPMKETDETEKEIASVGDSRAERSLQSFLRSTFQVAPLPEYPRKSEPAVLLKQQSVAHAARQHQDHTILMPS